MKASQVIAELKRLQKRHGDIEVFWSDGKNKLEPRVEPKTRISKPESNHILIKGR